MERRSFIATSASGLVALSAGCNGLPFFRKYSLRVDNYSPDNHSISVRVSNRDTNTIVEEIFEVDAETASDEILIDGAPSTIHVRVDSGSEQEFSWPSDDSGERFEHVYIWYDPERQADQDIFIYGE